MKNNHTDWTTGSTKNFIYRISSDFVEQLRDRMESKGWSQKRLAKALQISSGRVSQVFNNPGNLTLETMVEWAQVLGLKFSCLAYDDDDPQNKKGLINSNVFRICWEQANKPRDMWDIRELQQAKETAKTIIQYVYIDTATTKSPRGDIRSGNRPPFLDIAVTPSGYGLSAH